ncbi:tetratricopeptide repeat protein [Hymenobacter saemangeumensis]|uniref:Tetratricopeptide repeat protein n=1 Tax=Hymenobacter saemangeumensis TaxID=1084522 RepID=A0ABP8IRF7_9BACT
MSFKPWKKPFITAFALALAGNTAAIAQNVQSAQRAIELGRYSEARATLRSGDSPEAVYEMGRLYQFRDMPDSAAIYFNKAASQSPLGMVAMGRALLAKGEVSPAEAQFDAAVKATKGKDAKILTLIAQAYAESDVKDINKALSYVKAAEAINKKDEPALLVARGDIYLHTDQGGGEAMNSYDRATTANPSYAQAYYKKGVLSVRARNFNAARENLNKAIDLDPSYAPAYRELADMYYYAGQYELALSTFQKYIGLAEKSTATDAQYASFLYLTKKYPEALTEVNKVLQSDPNNLTMNRLRAYLLYETGDYAQASTAMDAYMKIAPENKIIAEDYIYQGKTLIKAGRAEEGIAIVKKAAASSTDPTKTEALENELAQAYMAKKDYPNAIALYKKKLASGKGDLTDQARMAIAFEGAKQYTQADSVYNIILTQKPTYVAGYRSRARVNFNMDPDSKKGLAKPHYEKYIEMASADAENAAKYREGMIEANNYLGYYHLQKGDKTAALPYYQQVLALDPANKDATTAIGIIKGTPKAPSKAPAKKAAAKK